MYRLLTFKVYLVIVWWVMPQGQMFGVILACFVIMACVFWGL